MTLSQQNIWIIDDDQSIRWVLERALQKADYKTHSFETASKALIQLKKGAQPQCILCDLRMPGIDGFEFLKQVKKMDVQLPIIIMTAYSDLDTTVQAYQDGAFEYLTKPFDIKEVVQLTNKACLQNKKTPKKAAQSMALSDQIIGESPAMQEVFRVIGRLSKSHISVLIEGESGTGKELVAQAVHLHSPRRDETFLSFNTAAIPQEALETELFGSDENLDNSRIGLFEKADLGTIFFDEIADMSMHIQTRVLRVLTEGELYRVGGSTPIKVDVRVIAATHQNLKQMVADNLFRNDLYHRLNVIRLHLPPLRKRKEDIPLLLNHFLQLSAKELNETVKKLSPEVSQFLSLLDWFGNVRQIENTCRWFTVMATGDEISMDDLPEDLLTSQPSNHIETIGQKNDDELTTSWDQSLAKWVERKLAAGEENIIKEASDILERTLLQETLKKTKGRKQDAARLIGWGRNTITRKIKDLDL